MTNLFIGDIPFNLREQRVAEAFFKQLAKSSIVSTSPDCISYTNLINENKEFAGTGGISENNHEFGFLPAFRNEESQEVKLSRTATGHFSPIHLLDFLPTDWFSLTKNDQLTLKTCITSGFVRQYQFYTREDAAKAVKIFNLEEAEIE
jgi:hypothetical protein